jgi:Ca2+-binding RTX toxin-like protein
MGRLWGRVGIGFALALVGVALAAATAVAAEESPPTEAPTPAEVAAAIPTPSCAEGPQRDGEVIVGTDCADHIVVPPTVTYVDGGPGNDTIVGSLTTAATSCPSGCHLEVGSQTFEGGEGNDLVYGDRGNDILRGNAGDDRLYGGIGDDRLEGGPGNDWLSGGFGADTIDGGEGNDYVRGDATVDKVFDTGGGYDTLSFATGVAPGFTAESNPTGATNFPPEAERGVFLELGKAGANAIDNEPSLGGGNDFVQQGVFERIIGTPFSDYIVGTSAAEEIIGGGGADVIRGGGGADTLRGGADGDYLEGGAGATLDGEAGTDGCSQTGALRVECETTAKVVEPRDTGTVSVGETAAPVGPGTGPGSVDIYLIGSGGADTVAATDTGAAVEFTLTAGAAFDAEAAAVSGCTLASGAEPRTATCPLGAPPTPAVPALDAIVLAGMGGKDRITASGFPDGAGVIELGGEGADELAGGPSEDVLVDGPGSGADTLSAGAGDDALLHNGGADTLEGGEGSDLFLSVSICDGETIKGGPTVGSDRDNASWARLPGIGVDARLDLGLVGEVGPNEAPVCSGARPLDHLEGIEDLEGSEGNDVLYGDAEANQLLGHHGADTYRALGGDDTIFANSGTADKVIDCGEGTEDVAVVDLAAVGDPPPIGCESVREGGANEFEEIIEQPLPAPITVTPPSQTQAPPPASPVPTPERTTKPKPDRTAPRTKLLGHPPKLLRVAPHHRAVVAIRFAASERSRFECKLDSHRYRGCRSPVRARLALGRHTIRVFAIDAAANRDKTPALLHLRVVTRR